jgi:hypothetical protein
LFGSYWLIAFYLGSARCLRSPWLSHICNQYSGKIWLSQLLNIPATIISHIFDRFWAIADIPNGSAKSEKSEPIRIFNEPFAWQFDAINEKFGTLKIYA